MQDKHRNEWRSGNAIPGNYWTPPPGQSEYGNSGQQQGTWTSPQKVVTSPGILTTSAPPFIPKSNPGSPSTPSSGLPNLQSMSGQGFARALYQSPAGYENPGSSAGMNSTAAPFVPQQMMSSMGASPILTSTVPGERMVQVTRGGCTFFVPESQALVEEGGTATRLLDESVYDWEPATAVTPRRRTLTALSMNETLRQTYLNQTSLMLRQMDPDDERYKEIPSQFYCVYPLDHESVRRGTAGSFGYPSAVYKVLSREDGCVYVLRRVDNIRTTNEICHSTVDMWRRVRHPSVINLHRAFCQHRALFFLRDYYPGAESMHLRYVDKRGPLLPEHLIWSYVSQIASALRAIHVAGLACRVVNASHMLLTGHNRVRINGCGVLDIIEYESKKSEVELQQEDVHCLGKLVLSLCCRSTITAATMSKSIDFVAQHYSAEMATFVVTLCSKPLSIFEVLSTYLTTHLVDELDRMCGNFDAVEGDLAKECENGRLFRLMVKLGLINERPEYNLDPNWAETGDRYLLKLFRDYVFHQVGEQNEPVIDFGHIVESLNKLDIGDSEKILLSSRDEQSILIASYKDLKRCVDDAFADLCRARNKPRVTSPLRPTQPLPPTFVPGRGRGRGGGGGRGFVR